MMPCLFYIFLNTSVPWKPFQIVSVLTLWQVAAAVTDPRAPSVGHCDKGPRLGLDRRVNHDISFRAIREVIFSDAYNTQTYDRQVFPPLKEILKPFVFWSICSPDKTTIIIPINVINFTVDLKSIFKTAYTSKHYIRWKSQYSCVTFKVNIVNGGTDF